MGQDKTKNEQMNFIKFLANIFKNFFWLGILLLVTSLFITKKMQDESTIWSSIYIFINGIGLALLTAYIFSFITGTNDFIVHVINLLKKVVIERKFLTDLNQEEKTNVIRELIKPSQDEKITYSNIDAYYDYYICNTLNVSTKNVRSDYSYIARVYYDSAKLRVMTHQTVTYRLHPNQNGYESIKVGYRKDLDNRCECIKISTPQGKRKEFKFGDLNFITKNIGGAEADMTEISLVDFNEINSHLKIEIELIEAGYDHWIPIQFQALQPTDGLRLIISIPEGFSIKRAETFGQGVDLHMDYSNDNRELIISCDQWLNEGAGVFAVVTKN